MGGSRLLQPDFPDFGPDHASLAAPASARVARHRANRYRVDSAHVDDTGVGGMADFFDPGSGLFDWISDDVGDITNRRALLQYLPFRDHRCGRAELDFSLAEECGKFSAYELDLSGAQCLSTVIAFHGRPRPLAHPCFHRHPILQNVGDAAFAAVGFGV